MTFLLAAEPLFSFCYVILSFTIFGIRAYCLLTHSGFVLEYVLFPYENGCKFSI